MNPIVSDRLTLRRFTPQDATGLFEYLSLPEVVHFEPYDPFTMEQAIAEAERRSHLDEFLAVCLNSDDRLIGNLYFQGQDPNDWGNWELGYVFHSAFQGMGYATEACQALLRHGFSDLGVRRVVAMCNPDNTPSWKLLERLGFRREGHLRQNVSFRNDTDGNHIWQDTCMYALLAEEFSTER